MRELHSLLVVDDEPIVRSTLSGMLRRTQFGAEFASSALEALAKIRHAAYQMILSDVKMPDMSGIDLVRKIRSSYPKTRIVLMTGFGSIDSAVESMRAGAVDYITKPFNRSDLLSTLDAALQSDDAIPNDLIPQRECNVQLIGSSRSTRDVVAFIHKISHSHSNVLLTGESGTGKDLVARLIHATSFPNGAPFVPINCSALPAELLESELFGHESGAFTGATGAKPGLFEIADGGTLFLDEVGDMSPPLQAKLLRVIQDREIRRIGGIASIEVDVRILAATNKDLEQEICNNRFREDLYYRLNVIPIRLAPLRERPEDIADLAVHFARTKAKRTKPSISPDVIRALESLPWYGNVRELENVIERALAVGDGASIRLEDISHFVSESDRDADRLTSMYRALAAHQIPLREIEMKVIEAALTLANGNKVKAARILGISRRTLYRRSPSCQPLPDDLDPLDATDPDSDSPSELGA
jgi:two-component system, NtrC family, response regulator AtoC